MTAIHAYFHAKRPRALPVAPALVRGWTVLPIFVLHRRLEAFRPHEGSLSVRMIEQPQPAQDFWPNERLLRFYDFQVFPRINPLHFFRKNNKVSPSVILAVTNAGIVQREKLDDA